MRSFKPTISLCIIALMLSSCAPILRKETTRTVIAGTYKNEKCKNLIKDNGLKTDGQDDFECAKAKIRKFILQSATIKEGITTFDDLKQLGFDTKAENVTLYPGSQGRKYILGTDNVQIQLSHPKQMGEYLEEDNRYLTIVYPLLNYKKITDRIYFSKKVIERKGADLNFVVIVYNNVVKKAYYLGTENLNEKEVENAFGQGVIDILKGIREINPIRF